MQRHIIDTANNSKRALKHIPDLISRLRAYKASRNRPKPPKTTAATLLTATSTFDEASLTLPPLLPPLVPEFEKDVGVDVAVPVAVLVELVLNDEVKELRPLPLLPLPEPEQPLEVDPFPQRQQIRGYSSVKYRKLTATQHFPTVAEHVSPASQ